MIILPSRNLIRRQIRREYERLLSILDHCSHLQVESIMRRIHMLNFKLKNYERHKERYDKEEEY